VGKRGSRAFFNHVGIQGFPSEKPPEKNVQRERVASKGPDGACFHPFFLQPTSGLDGLEAKKDLQKEKGDKKSGGA